MISLCLSVSMSTFSLSASLVGAIPRLLYAQCFLENAQTQVELLVGHHEGRGETNRLFAGQIDQRPTLAAAGDYSRRILDHLHPDQQTPAANVDNLVWQSLL